MKSVYEKLYDNAKNNVDFKQSQENFIADFLGLDLDLKILDRKFFSFKNKSINKVMINFSEINHSGKVSSITRKRFYFNSDIFHDEDEMNDFTYLSSRDIKKSVPDILVPYVVSSFCNSATAIENNNKDIPYEYRKDFMLRVLYDIDFNKVISLAVIIHSFYKIYGFVIDYNLAEKLLRYNLVLQYSGRDNTEPLSFYEIDIFKEIICFKNQKLTEESKELLDLNFEY